MIIPPTHCMFYFSDPQAFPHRGANCNAREGHRKGPDIRLNLRRIPGRGARASLRALPPPASLWFSCRPLALPLGELSPKVTERALQARSNGNSKQRESQVSLSGGCAASSPKGRAKYRSQRTAAVVHTAVAVNYLMNTPCPPEAFPCSGQYCEIAAPCSARLAMTSQETCRVRGGAQGGRQGICIPRLKAIGAWGKCGLFSSFSCIFSTLRECGCTQPRKIGAG